MLHITTKETELFNQETNQFTYIKPMKLVMEHSLVAISKWESKWHKPFLDYNKKTTEEILDYIRCMTITQNVPEEIFRYLSDENVSAIKDYINDPMTATRINEIKQGPSNKEILTSELIYFLMVSYGIPFECQKWNINRLITLIKVCQIKNGDSKKMSKHDIQNQNKMLNAQRRARLKSKG